MSAIELRPCPFCGSGAKGHKVQTKERGINYVRCANPLCLACGPDAETAAEAAEKWNIRVEDNPENPEKGR